MSDGISTWLRYHLCNLLYHPTILKHFMNFWKVKKYVSAHHQRDIVDKWMSFPTKINSGDTTFELLITEKLRIDITCSTKNVLELSTIMHKVSVCIKMMGDFMGQPMLHNQHNTVHSHSSNEKGVLGCWLCIKCTSSHQGVRVCQKIR